MSLELYQHIILDFFFFILCILTYVIKVGTTTAFIIQQILVGIFLMLSAQYNMIDCKHRKKALMYNNFITVGVFLITVVNVFTATFDGPSTPIVSLKESSANYSLHI